MMKIKDGVFKIYHDEEGIVLWSKNFIFNNKNEGEYKKYYGNGKILELCNYNNNKIEGEYKSYHDNEQLWEICNLKNGKMKGEYKVYPEN